MALRASQRSNAVQLAVNQANVGGGYTLSLIAYNDVSATLGKQRS